MVRGRELPSVRAPRVVVRRAPGRRSGHRARRGVVGALRSRRLHSVPDGAPRHDVSREARFAVGGVAAAVAFRGDGGTRARAHAQRPRASWRAARAVRPCGPPRRHAARPLHGRGRAKRSRVRPLACRPRLAVARERAARAAVARGQQRFVAAAPRAGARDPAARRGPDLRRPRLWRERWWAWASGPAQPAPGRRRYALARRRRHRELHHRRPVLVSLRARPQRAARGRSHARDHARGAARLGRARRGRVGGCGVPRRGARRRAAARHRRHAGLRRGPHRMGRARRGDDRRADAPRRRAGRGGRVAAIRRGRLQG